MNTDPAIPVFIASILAILLLGTILKFFRQPHVIVYLLVGVLLGPNVLGVIGDQISLTRLGSFGVVLLLFFVGMEVSPKRLVENWMIAVIGTVLQVFISVGAVFVLGYYLDWSAPRIVLMGFVISLSSTAVVLKLLENWREMNTRVGQDVVGILLVQDLIIVPMLIILGLWSGIKPSMHTISLQVLGGVLIIAITAWIVIKEEIKLPWLRYLGKDHEMQVFVALGICFGMAFITGITQLSAALGAFVGGMIVSSAKETAWVHSSLSSIRTIFIALFFVSVGMLIDPDFIVENWILISTLILLVLLTNTFINGLILKLLGESWPISIYGGSLLSQIGEFSFIIASVGYQMKIIQAPTYKLTITIIALTLLISPLWISLIKLFFKLNIKNTGAPA